PDTRLPEETIARHLGVSRTPVREALRRLEHEKLVVYTPQQGYSTRSIELREFNELYQVRAVLEEYAVVQAIEAMENPDCREMLEDLRQTWVRRVTQPPDTEAMDLLDEDEAFHESIALASENRYLHELLQSINTRIRSIRLVDFNYP